MDDNEACAERKFPRIFDLQVNAKHESRKKREEKENGLFYFSRANLRVLSRVRARFTIGGASFSKAIIITIVITARARAGKRGCTYDVTLLTANFTPEASAMRDEAAAAGY